MASPIRPGTKPEVDPEVEKTIRERLATFEEDRKSAVNAHEALAAIRQNLKQLSPR
jgi:hypothetical protein